MVTDSKAEKNNLVLQGLLETYKVICDEMLLYSKEMVRCFMFASVLVALYLGLGMGSTLDIVKKIQVFIPVGFFILIIYFLSIVYLRMSLSQYRYFIESRISELTGDSTVGLYSKYLIEIQGGGFLKFGKKKFSRIPSPMLLLGIVALLVTYMIFSGIDFRQLSILKPHILVLTVFILTIFVYFIFPTLARKALKRLEQSNSHLKNNKERKKSDR